MAPAVVPFANMRRVPFFNGINRWRKSRSRLRRS